MANTPTDADRRRVLIQLDTDAHASSFDAVVAIDAGVDHLLSYARVEPGQVTSLVHGAMFTRGPKHLKNTAIFIGGSDVTQGESLLHQVARTFFGPMRVSVMLDSNGANTTATAAVLAAGGHLDLSAIQAVVLGGTGPVGQRVARLLAGQGAQVRLLSRDQARAQQTARRINQTLNSNQVQGHAPADDPALAKVLQDAALVVSAGAAGVTLLPRAVWQQAPDLQVAIDLNAVAPAGIEGVELTDTAAMREQVTCYGAIGVGGLKMKIHKAAIASLFQSNDRVLDAETILALAQGTAD